jgi:hypothetical protein
MPPTINPYAPPKAAVEDVVAYSGEAEAIRREHIQREAAIRSIGILYYIAAAGLLVVSLAALAGSNAGLGGLGVTGRAPLAFMGIFFVAFGAGLIFVGRALRQLRPWARIAAIVIAFLGLLNAPTGTLINIYILYLLFSEKGRRIFESDYPEIVAATPDVKAKTSIIVWVFLGLLVFAILAAVLIPAIGRHR